MLPVVAAAQPSDFKRAGIIIVMSVCLSAPTSADFARLADEKARRDCASCEHRSPTALLAIQGSRTLGRFSLVRSVAAARADLGAASASLERLAAALTGYGFCGSRWHERLPFDGSILNQSSGSRQLVFWLFAIAWIA
jgi:hypothetical protein